MNASIPAFCNAEARVDWRVRNSERDIGGTSRSGTWDSRVDQAQVSRPLDVRLRDMSQCLEKEISRKMSTKAEKISRIMQVLQRLFLARRLDFPGLSDGRRGVLEAFSEIGGNIVNA
jgi:hypothetical protein